MSAERKVVVGVVATLICGAVIVASTFMPWLGFQEEGYSSYGSAWVHIDIIRDTEHSPFDYFVDKGFGNIIFTGYIFAVIGALMVLASIILFFRRGRAAVAVSALLYLAFTAAFISGVNIYSMSTADIPNSDTSMLVGIGLYISLAFSILGLVGYFIIYSGMRDRDLHQQRT